MDATGLQTLADEKRQAAVDRILRCARLFVAAHGLDVTVEQIADAAGVSRRTLFRLFPTRDELLAAAISAGLARYADELPAYRGGDWRAWLHELCRAVHRMNASCGPGFWELATRHHLPPGLSAIEQQRRRGRRAVMTALADTLWSAANGPGRPPRTLAPAVAAYLSPHFTAAVTDDAGQDWRQAADEANTAIERLMRHELIRKHTG
jgi:AcrR family transcriptional regulator